MSKTTSVREAFKRAADWLARHPRQHDRGALARKADGHATSPTNPEAVCFCAIGRVMKELGADTQTGTTGGAKLFLYNRLVNEGCSIPYEALSHVVGLNDSRQLGAAINALRDIGECNV